MSIIINFRQILKNTPTLMANGSLVFCRFTKFLPIITLYKHVYNLKME